MPRKKRQESHYEHSKMMRHSKGLPGSIRRPLKITLLGAGSGFTLHFLCDILQIHDSQEIEFALVDIDSKRLKTMESLACLTVETSGRKDVTIVASTDRHEVLEGSNYLINCIEVSGIRCVKYDYDIPRSYGVDQCIGDTIGPGGLFKGLRTIPSWIEILKDAERMCPNATVLNYTNPMGMMCLAAAWTSSMKVVGLCHSVQGTSDLLARRADVPLTEMDWECAGINHLAWFTRLEHNGKDLYPLLKKKARQDLAGRPSDPDDAGDLVRKDMMLQFGAFITESSGHLSEYLPYYRKRDDLIEKYGGDQYEGGRGFYAKQWPQWRKKADEDRKRMLESGKISIGERTWEYASWIIEAIEKNRPFKIHGNVPNARNGNDALISNLPAEGCVEVACLVDGGGIQPIPYGKLPTPMAAICASNMYTIQTGALAAVEKSKELAIEALMLDPLSSAVCSPSEIRDMANALFKAESRYLPGYK